MKTRHQAVLLILILILPLYFGCSTSGSQSSHFRRFTDLLAEFPPSYEPLKLPKLTGASCAAVSSGSRSRDVFIMVHPAYSLFFRDANRSKYPEAKYRLLLKQFSSEASFIREAARSGRIMVLIVPANYGAESIAPLSYTFYLNAMAPDAESVFYLFSESAGNGSILTNDMVELYHFLAGIKAKRIFIGGGFIGRCQREFYKQITPYLDETAAYIVPEISTISPDDISEAEAGRILESIEVLDYSPVREFINLKLDNVRFLPLSEIKND